MIEYWLYTESNSILIHNVLEIAPIIFIKMKVIVYGLKFLIVTVIIII